MKNLKKILLACLVMLLVLALVACEIGGGGSNNKDNDGNTNNGGENQTQPEQTIKIRYSVTDVSGNATTRTISVSLNAGETLTLDAFCSAYTIWSFADSAAYGSWKVNGTTVTDGGFKLQGGEEVSFVQTKKYSVNFKTTYQGEENAAVIEISEASISLYAFLTNYVGMTNISFAELLEMGTVQVNGKEVDESAATMLLPANCSVVVRLNRLPGNSGNEDEPGTDTPGTDTPGTDTPGTDTPGTDTPGTDTPGTDTPDQPGSGNTPGTDTPDQPGSGDTPEKTIHITITMINSDGKTTEMSVTTPASISLGALVKQVFEIDFDSTLSNTEWRVNDRPANADTIISADAQVTAYITNVAEEYITVTLSADTHSASLSVPKGISLRDFAEEYLGNGVLSYEEILLSYTITVNGAVVDGKYVLADKDQIFLSAIGGSTPETITVKYSINGEYYPDVLIDQGTSLRGFVESMIDDTETYEDLLLVYDVTVNGAAVDPEYVLKENDSVEFSQKSIVEPETVTVTYSHAGGSNSVDLPAGTTLKQFVEEYLAAGNMTYEEVMKMIDLTVNGNAVDPDYVLQNGDKIFAEVITQPADTITVTFVVDGNTYTQEIVNGTPLADFVEMFIGGSQYTYDDLLAAFDITVNGDTMSRYYTLKDGDIIVLTEKTEPEFPIYFSMVDSEGNIIHESPYTMPVGNPTLSNFYSMYFGGDGSTIEDTYQNTKWYVNGEPADGSTPIREDDRITAVVTIPKDEPREIFVNFEIYIPATGTTDTFEAVCFPDGTTLAEAVSEWFGISFDQTLTAFKWYVNGELASGDTVLQDGDDIYGESFVKDEPAKEIVVDFEIHNPDTGMTQFYHDVRFPNGTTLAQAVEAQLGDAFDKTLDRIRWYVNGMPASGDTVLQDADDIYGEEIVQEEPSNEIMVNFELFDPSTGASEIYGDNYFLIGTTLAQAVEEQLGVPFEKTLGKIEWYVNGELASGDTVLQDGAFIYGEVITQDEPSKEITVTYETLDISTQTGTKLPDLVFPAGTTLRQMYSIMFGSDIEKSLEHTTWYINGDPADLDQILCDGDYILGKINPFAGEESEETTVVITIYDIASGKLEQSSERKYPINITLGEVFYDFFGYEIEKTYAFVTWYVNDQLANADTVLPLDANVYAEYDSSKDPNAEPEEPDNTITVYLISPDYADQFTVNKDILLREFIELYLLKGEISYKEFSNAYSVTVNGEMVSAKYLLQDGDTVYVTAKPIEPEQPQSIEISYYDFTLGAGNHLIPVGTTLQVYLEGILLNMPYDTACKQYSISVNGMMPYPDYVLQSGDTVYLFDRTTTPDGNGINVVIQFVDPFLQIVQRNETYVVPNGIALKIFAENFPCKEETFEDTLQYAEWYVNHQPAQANTKLQNGDLITVMLTESEAPEKVINVQIQLVDKNTGIVDSTRNYILPEGITLAKFFEEFGGSGESFEQSLSYVQWLVNHVPANADTVLNDGDLIIAILDLGLGGGDIEEPAMPELPNYEIYLPAVEEKQMIVQIVSGNTVYSTVITSASAPLNRFFDRNMADMLGAKYVEIVEYATILIDGIPAASEDKVRYGAVVTVVLPNYDEPLVPEAGEMLITVVVGEDSEYEQLRLVVKEHMDLNDLCYYLFDKSAKEISKLADLSVNGAIANDMTILTPNAMVVILAREDDGGDSGDNNDEGTTDGQITISIQEINSATGEVMNLYPYSLPAGTTIREFYENYYRPGESYDNHRKHMLIKVTGLLELYESYELRNGDNLVIRMIMDSNITIQTIVYHPDGKKVSAKIDIPEGTSLRQLYEEYSGATYEGSLGIYTWEINGKPANPEHIFSQGDRLIVRISVPAEDKDITVQITFISIDGIEHTGSMVIDPNLTLKQFCSIYLGKDFDETLAYTDWYVNDMSADMDTILHDGDYILAKEFDIPLHANELKVIFHDQEKGTYEIKYFSIPNSIEMWEFCELFLGETYDQTLQYIVWMVDHTPVTAGTRLWIGTTLEAFVTYSNKPVNPTDTIHVSLIITNADGRILEKAPYTLHPGTTLWEFYDKYLSTGNSFEQTLSYMEWTVNGKPADPYAPLNNYDTIKAISYGEQEKPGDNEIINVSMSFIDEMAGNGSGTYMDIKAGMTLAEFYAEYFDGDFEASLKTTKWTINGQPAYADTIIQNNDIIVATINMVEEETITVEMEIIDEATGETLTEKQQIPANLTLAELCSNHFGIEYEETLIRVKWEINGKPADPSDVIREGDRITIIAKASIEPGKGEIVINYVLVIPEKDVEQKTQLLVKEGMTLGEFYRYISQDAGEIEDTYGHVQWYVDGKSADASTPLYNNVEVRVVVKSSVNPDEPDTPDTPDTPDEPDEPTGTIIVTFVVVDVESGEKQANSFPVNAGITLREFFYNVTNESFESTLSYTVWTVNGMAADGSTILSDGCTILAQVSPSKNDGSKIYVHFTVVDAYGKIERDEEIAIEEGMTLENFAISHFAVFSDTLEHAVWLVNGNPVYDGNFILNRGDVILVEFLPETAPEKPFGAEVEFVLVDMISGEYITRYYSIPDGLTFSDFYKQYLIPYFGCDFEQTLKHTNWYLDGNNVDMSSILRGSVYIKAESYETSLNPGSPSLPDNGESDEPGDSTEVIRVVLTTVNMSTGEERTSIYSVPANLYLKKFIEEYTNINYAEVAEYTVWFVNGRVANARTILHSGDEVRAEMRIDAGEETDEIAVHLEVIIENNGQMHSTSVMLPASIQINEFEKTFLTQDLEKHYNASVLQYRFILNGEEVNGRTFLKDGDLLQIYVIFMEEETPEEVKIPMNVTVHIGNNGEHVSMNFTIPEYITLAAFESNFFIPHLQKQYGLPIRNLSWDVNGESGYGRQQLTRDSKIVVYVDFCENEDDFPMDDYLAEEYRVYLVQQSGDEWYGTYITIESSDRMVSLRYLFEEYIASGIKFEETEKDYTWKVNGLLANADTMLPENCQVTVIVNAVPESKPEDGQITITMESIFSNTGTVNGMYVHVYPGMTLEEVFNYASKGELLFKDVEKQYSWYVDNEPATADTIINAGAYIAIIAEANKPGVDHDNNGSADNDFGGSIEGGNSGNDDSFSDSAEGDYSGSIVIKPVNPDGSTNGDDFVVVYPGSNGNGTATIVPGGTATIVPGGTATFDPSLGLNGSMTYDPSLGGSFAVVTPSDSATNNYAVSMNSANAMNSMYAVNGSVSYTFTTVA